MWLCSLTNYLKLWSPAVLSSSSDDLVLQLRPQNCEVVVRYQNKDKDCVSETDLCVYHLPQTVHYSVHLAHVHLLDFSSSAT